MEKLSFQADISELMNLIVHAFYSNRDVFLREVMSNASDALDKQRYHDLQQSKLDQDYRIRISTLEHQLVIEDSGIGMSHDDLVQNLSTIAKSGTKEFMKQAQQASEQIGQFGVGFYSVFLVADHVDVWTQKEGHPVFRWSSDAQQFYTLEEVTEDTPFFESGHGTKLVLSLKEDAREYLEEATIRRIVETHSSFITYRIELWVKKEVTVETETVEEGTEVVEEVDLSNDTEDVVVEETSEPTESTTTTTPPQTQWTEQWERLNGDRPIWYLSPSDVKVEDYHALYKTVSSTKYEDPLFYRHFQTEGTYEFKGILFIPKMAPFDLVGNHTREKRPIRLYVKKVLVLNELDKEMLPDWMSFVTGVIDSSDLPLNVSREMLQQTKVLKVMKLQLKKQIQTMLTTLMDEHPDLYKTFYSQFQRNIKLGIHEGDDSLLRFLRIPCSKGGDTKDISLTDYVDHYRMEDQKHIYYATGAEAESCVLTKLYQSKGYFVLFFKEPIDEFMLQRVTKFGEYDLVNINKDHEVPWNTSVKETQEEFCGWITKTLNDPQIEKTRLSASLSSETDAPCCVLSSKFGWTGNMEKIMMSQPMSDPKTMMFMKGKKTLELNWNHPLIQRFYTIFQTNQEDSAVGSQLTLLYQSSLLAAGFPLENTHQLLDNVVQCLSVVSQ